jgi:hypothetical protein
MFSIVAQLLRAARELRAIHHLHHKHVMVGLRLELLRALTTVAQGSGRGMTVHVSAVSASSRCPYRTRKPQSGVAPD